PRATSPFSMLGVTWTDAHAVLRGSVQVRTRSAVTGAWTSWLTMTPEDELPDPTELSRPGVRGGMSPMWTGAANGVQVRAVAKHGVTALPTGLTVDLVDPGSAHTRGGGRRPASHPVAMAGYRMGITDSPSPSSSSPPDTSSPSPSGTGSPTDTPSPADTTPVPAPSSPGTPTTTGATSPSASPSPSQSPWPAQLPTLAEAYPQCGKSGGTQTMPSPVPGPTNSPVAPPAVVTRADWSADECARTAGYPAYGTSVQAMFVHHTDTTNSYSCAASPLIVRSIYAEHMRQGWADIGYNFLVDKCGTIFEGRFGGMGLPVIGAQTYGFNTDTMGVAAIGTYTDLSGGDYKASTYTGAAPSKAMMGSIARIAAWKFGMTHVDPATGQATLTERAADSYGFKLNQTYIRNVISGHRDGYATDCPGNQLYGQLGTIRTYAAGPVAGVAINGVSGGAAKSGTGYYTKGAATVSWTTTTPATVISGFDVLVDGQVAAHAGGTATSASISVGAGQHTVQVRATHVRGTTSLSAGVTLVGDSTAPTFSTKPALGLRTGPVSSTSAPVTLTWKAADNAALTSVAASSPSAATFSPTTTSWATWAKIGVHDVFTLKATDVAGNAGTASTTGTPSLIQETSASRTGKWTLRSSSSYLGGHSYSSSAKGASISWTFTGRSVAWIVSRASTSGQAYVYVDGVKIGIKDLKSGSTSYRQAIWTKTWSTSGKHTLKIVVVGTTGRPTVTTDGIAVLS
ncbi:MAG: hypothetical protein JWN52_6680, partial [Actinomycetia bacterium]|nr:hypothetical protein [Actinomycetes bacterium]